MQGLGLECHWCKLHFKMEVIGSNKFTIVREIKFLQLDNVITLEIFIAMKYHISPNLVPLT
jgi:hypothetical protein